MVEVRECVQADVALLEEGFPVPGQPFIHQARFDRQQAGASTFLIAWLGGELAGSAEVLWEGCRAAEVQDRFPGCPEINGLNVCPVLRSRGIGTAIVGEAETRAARRGHSRIGLGVEDTNVRAAALYQRLGYERTGCSYLDRYHYLVEDGIRCDVADHAQFLIKALAALARPVPPHTRAVISSTPTPPCSGTARPAPAAARGRARRRGRKQ